MLNRKIAPPFQNDLSLRLLSPVEYTLANGAISYFIQGGTQEVVKIEIVFPAGRWFEQTPGLAYLTANLSPKGTSKHTSNQIAEHFDFYGAHLEVEAGFDSVSITLFTLTKNLTSTIQQLFEVLVNPSFPEKEINQFKSAYLQNLKVNNQKTNYVASKEIRKMIFGDSHPYGVEVSEGDISSIDQVQLSTFHKHHFVNPIAFISGNFTTTEVDIINQLLETIRNTAPLLPSIDSVEKSPTSKRVEKKESVQSSLRMGKTTINPMHSDYPKAHFVNHMLGGYFGSRLMKNIREDKGLTYGIYASMHALKHASLLTIGADVNSENRELVFDEIKMELRKLQSELVSENELETARAHYIGSLQADISTPFAHADKIKELVLNSLPSNHYQHVIDNISIMTPITVMETAIQYFKEESFFEVAVG